MEREAATGRDLHGIHCDIHSGETCSREPACPRDDDHGDDEAAESVAEAFQDIAREQSASAEVLSRRRAAEEKLGKFLAAPVKTGASWSETVDAAIEADASHPEPHPGAGFEYDSLATFRDAARKLKAAESAVAEARTEYAEAVKRLSEEAVR